MREMKDSGIEWIGEIPAQWQVSKIKYFFDCLDRVFDRVHFGYGTCRKQAFTAKQKAL